MDPAAELTPALLVLNKLVTASDDVKIAVKQAIFPPESDKVSQTLHSLVTLFSSTALVPSHELPTVPRKNRDAQATTGLSNYAEKQGAEEYFQGVNSCLQSSLLPVYMCRLFQTLSPFRGEVAS